MMARETMEVIENGSRATSGGEHGEEAWVEKE